MAEIVGIDGLTDQQLTREIQNGGKFVIYRYCISLILVSFKQPSAIYFVRSDESRFATACRTRFCRSF